MVPVHSKNRFVYSRISVSIIFILFLLASIANSPLVSAEEAPIIKLVDIKGNKRIGTESIESKIMSRAGTPFSQKTVQNDIQTLYGLGYFDDIRVEIEPFEGGIKLIILLKEKPTIISVDFAGNEKLESDDLAGQITITPGAIANQALILRNVDRLVSYYQSEGYWHVSVLPILKEVSAETTAVTFQIEEGPKVKIKKVTIEGNRAISSGKIKKAMRTGKWWLFSFLSGSGYYKKEEMKMDIERIRKLYHSNGYIQVVISEPEITMNPKKTGIYIKISLSEGDQYKVGEVSFSGNTVFESSRFYEKIDTAPGKIFNRGALRNDIDRILSMYTERGYATADINPLIDVNEEGKTVSLELAVTEGEIFRIGRVEIFGNEKTRDKVIRREVRFDEGDIYNSKLLRRSYQRITNLDFFESVELNPKPRLQERLIDIDVTVKEKLTGMMTIGGGYSSVDEFIAMGEITQRNLFGKGLTLKLKADISGRRTNYNITLINPWFMDRPISASVNVYNETFKYDVYDKKTIGGSLGFGKELSEYVRGSITYSFEQIRVTNISENASDFIKDQEGIKITSSIHPSIWRDTRDNYIDPARGSKNSVYVTVAGLGGDNYFVKTVGDSAWFFPVIWDTTFMMRGRLGYASGWNGKELPIYERFYIGGIDTVRGLDFGEGGPRDSAGVVIGGSRELIFNVEYIFPIERSLRLKGLVFFDAGKAEDDFKELLDLRTTAGFGVRWISPFGPIRIEWGFNLDPKADETDSKIEFAMGGSF